MKTLKPGISNWKDKQATKAKSQRDAEYYLRVSHYYRRLEKIGDTPDEDFDRDFGFFDGEF